MPFSPSIYSLDTQSFAGVIKNPHTTIVFNGVNLRAINLEWRMSARTQQETDIIKSIQDTIKLRAHPEEAIS